MKIAGYKLHLEIVWFGFKSMLFTVRLSRYITGCELDFHLGPCSVFIWTDKVRN